MKKLILFAMFPLFLSLFLLPVYAGEGDVNINEIPDRLAEQLNIDLTSARLLTCIIVFAITLFPSIMIGGYFGGLGGAILATIIVGLPVGGFLVTMGWLPIWVYALTCILVGLMFSGKMRGWISGSGDRGD